MVFRGGFFIRGAYVSCGWKDAYMEYVVSEDFGFLGLGISPLFTHLMHYVVCIPSTIRRLADEGDSFFDISQDRSIVLQEIKISCHFFPKILRRLDHREYIHTHIYIKAKR